MKYSMSAKAILLTVIYAVLLSVLKAQEIKVSPEVWGYIGQEEVILPCRFISGKDEPGVTLVQWTFQNFSEGDRHKLVVSMENEMHIQDEKYKDKLAMKEYSLVIKNVDLEDAGVYTCALSTFPSGPFSDRTTLFVNEQEPLSAGVVAAVVITVTVLLGIITATVYFIVIRRCPPSPWNHISIDTHNAERDPSKPSIIKREDSRKEVIYTTVELQPANHKREIPADGHVIYSDIKVTRKKPEKTMYTEVMQI